LKVKLVVSNERYEEIKGFLLDHGIEIDDDADLLLSENNRFPDNIVVKAAITNERVVLPVEEIAYIKPMGILLRFIQKTIHIKLWIDYTKL